MLTMNNLSVVISHWRIIFVILVPLVFLPLIFLDEQTEEFEGAEPVTSTKFKCAYVILLMALYWVVEAVPLAVTSFLPIVLLPILGIQSTGQVSVNYMKETNLMFMGGLIVSFAIEYSNLHRRIALRVLTLIGSSPTKILLGVMMTTMFLSMWILNSATASMMIPVVLAVLDELNKNNDSCENYVNGFPLSISQDMLKIEKDIVDQSTTIDICPSKIDEAYRKKRQKQMMLLAVCYASDIGGSGVVTGTTPNTVAFQLIKETGFSQDGKYVDLTFATWMAYAVPPMLVNVTIAWMYLTVAFLGLPDWLKFKVKKEDLIMKNAEKRRTEKRVENLLMGEYKKLGGMTFHQIAVSIMYMLLIILWLFREPRFVPGWASWFPNVNIGDSTSAMFVVLLLFAVPKDPSFLRCKTAKVNGALLDWKYVSSKVPWDIVLLMGSGFAISDAADKSGLSKWIGNQLEVLSSLNPYVILIIVMILISSLTEVLSNAACANIVVPILISLSEQLNLHPLYLTLPAAISCSFAFMFPIGAPTNGIVYAAGGDDLRIWDMCKQGLFIKVFCTLFHYLIHISYGNLIFSFSNYNYQNVTGLP